MPDEMECRGAPGSRIVTGAARCTGAVTDTYDYDAWGKTANQTGSTPNVYLYRGEQRDPDLNLYYRRARYFNPLTGRLLTTNPPVKKIRIKLPSTLHKYLYVGADPHGGCRRLVDDSDRLPKSAHQFYTEIY